MKIRLLALLFLCFYHSLSIYSQDSKRVSFDVAKNYFVNNTYQNSNIQFFKILDLKKLNEIMGMSTVMGADGRPTKIDFKNEFAIAVIHSQTDTMTELEPIQLVANGKRNLVLEYKKILGHKMTYAIKPHLLILVERKYRNYKLNTIQGK